MSWKKLRDAITRTETTKISGMGSTWTRTVETKPELRIRVCDHCGEGFSMLKWCNDQQAPGRWDATMNEPTPAGEGNGLSLDVCSFHCADELTRGAWASASEDAERFASSGSTPGRILVSITSMYKSEARLVAEWEALQEKTPAGEEVTP